MKKIAILVGGKFHADRMANALWKNGHDVRLFTTVPKNRFPELPTDRIYPFVSYEIIHRLAMKLGHENRGDLWKIRKFGLRVAQELGRSRWNPDIILSWSSFGLETFETFPHAVKIVIRDSAHIAEQMAVFAEEFKRRNVPFPDRRICVERETQEYQIADRILVCSDFIRDTFLKHGVPSVKIHKIRLGVDTRRFSPRHPAKVNRPLQVVYFGGITIYKGVYYLLEATKDFSPAELQLTLIGQVSREFQPFLKVHGHPKLVSQLPHAELSDRLKTMDVFVMPSLQDGWGSVVPQAMASGLANIVSTSCGSRELVRDGENGILIPPADTAAIRAVLTDLIQNPENAERLGRSAASQSAALSWLNYEIAISNWINEMAGLPAAA